MYGINEKVYNNLQKYFKESSYIFEVILFGSRAKGNYKFNSDIDLCIKCPRETRSRVLDSIDDIIGIYSCDILFKDSLNDDVRKQIDKYGVKIYNK